VKPTEEVNSLRKTEPEIWFDDVDELLIEGLRNTQVESPAAVKKNSEVHSAIKKSESHKGNPLVKPESFAGTTKVVAMDCEMVGVGEEGKDSVLARVSMVNQFGYCIYDKYVKPTEEVTDYRTFVSGIRPHNIAEGEEFSVVQKEVADLIKGRILVGHAVMNDLKVLYLSHPKKKIRDTSRYRPFRQLSGGRTPGLKKLCQKVLGVEVQEGEHSSVQDAQGAMRLYTMKRKGWEKSIRERAGLGGKKNVSVKTKGKMTKISSNK
jgi:RNA exonuclease 4